MNEDEVKVLKQIRNLLLTKFLTKLAADREILTDWMQSIDAAINTGEIAVNSSVQYVIAVPKDSVLVAEKMEWKLSEWWTATVQWTRDGVNVYEEDNTVDGKTSATIAPAYDSSLITITNNSSANTVSCLLRWHYAIADRAIYMGFQTDAFRLATEIIKEMAGIPEKEEGGEEVK